MHSTTRLLNSSLERGGYKHDPATCTQSSGPTLKNPRTTEYNDRTVKPGECV